MILSSCGNIKTDSHGKELISHGSALFPIACYLDDLSSECVDWHWHEELEFVVAARGTAIITSGTQKYALRQGEGFFINSGILHAGWGIEGTDCKLHSLVFHPRLVGGSVDSIFWQNYVQPLLSNASLPQLHFDGSQSWHQELIQLIELAWQSCKQENYGYEFQVRAALSQVLLQLSNFHPKESKIPSEKTLRDNERMKQMLYFIQEHFAEPITVDDIATQALISPSECLRCFHSLIGTSPNRYLQQFRLLRAMELLISSQAKIIDIGVQCGFSDPSYFVKCFRKQTGYTPSAYRKHHTEASLF